MYPPVDAEIYQEMTAELGRDFAFSYLVRAGQIGKTITPYTVTAYDRLRQNFTAMKVLGRHGIRLVKPKPWSEDRKLLENHMDRAA